MILSCNSTYCGSCPVTPPPVDLTMAFFFYGHCPLSYAFCVYAGASTLTLLLWVYFDLQYNGSYCRALFCSYCDSLSSFVVLILSFMSLHSVTPLETNPPVEPLTQLRIN